MMKDLIYIFLDVDGVLNTSVEKKTNKYIGSNRSYFIDTYLVNNLKIIYDKIGKDNIRIVLSSNWRKEVKAFNCLSEYLKTLDISLFDYTNNYHYPIDQSDSLIIQRVFYINEYLNKLPIDIKFIILDDLPLEKYFHSNKFVHTHQHYGLTHKKRNEVFRKLNIND